MCDAFGRPGRAPHTSPPHGGYSLTPSDKPAPSDFLKISPFPALNPSRPIAEQRDETQDKQRWLSRAHPPQPLLIRCFQNMPTTLILTASSDRGGLAFQAIPSFNFLNNGTPQKQTSCPVSRARSQLGQAAGGERGPAARLQLRRTPSLWSRFIHWNRPKVMAMETWL